MFIDFNISKVKKYTSWPYFSDKVDCHFSIDTISLLWVEEIQSP